MPKFSVIIPVYSELQPLQEGAAGHLHFRGKTVQRAIKSIINQQFPDWELIVIDDGCVDGLTPAILDKFAASDPRIKIIHQTNQNRAVSRNNGMEAATGEWLCWLDCDDEYSTNYLREIDAASQDYPHAKIFNFGSIIYWPDHHTEIRHTYRPKIEGDGHEWFRSGHIGAGSFVFKKELWASDPKYRIPDEPNPYQFAADSLFPYRLTREEDPWKYDNTENPDTMFQDGVKRHGSSIGNPWGDDFLQFYLLTRDNHSQPLHETEYDEFGQPKGGQKDVLLYIQYPRAHEDRYEHFGDIYDTV